jgi:inorganic phosphate transporter, PiT family
MELLLVAVIVMALVFDFTNGFQDTANSVATIIGTRAMEPKAAVTMAALLNFAGAFISLEVAATVGKGVIDPNSATLTVVLAGVTAAMVWNITTWYFGIPASASHGLIGGLVGAGVAGAGFSAIQWGGAVNKVLVPSIIAPIVGFLGAMLLMAVLMRMVRNANPKNMNRRFRNAQIFTGAWLSVTHGMNDAQKTMGIMALALVTAGHLDADAFEIPFWVVFSAASAMGLGTYVGGWRVIKTLGTKVVRMNPLQGFSASVGAAGVLQFAGTVGLPVSTTQCISGSVLGAGASRRASSVRWTVAGNMVVAWMITLPAAATVGATCYLLASINPVLLLAAAATFAFLIRRRADADEASLRNSAPPEPMRMPDLPTIMGVPVAAANAEASASMPGVGGVPTSVEPPRTPIGS